MAETEKPERTPPYIAYSTFRTFMEGLKEHGVPAQVDRGVVSNFSGSVATQLLTALKFLGLVDKDWKTTPRLSELREAFQTPRWSNALAAVLRDAYKSVMALDLKAATMKMVETAFVDHYKVGDSVRPKCVTFFVHAAKDAALPLSPHVTNKTRRGGKRASKPKTQPKTGAAIASPAVAAPPSPSSNGHAKKPAEILYEILDPTKMTDVEQAAVFTLMTYLKKAEVGQ